MSPGSTVCLLSLTPALSQRERGWSSVDVGLRRLHRRSPTSSGQCTNSSANTLSRVMGRSRTRLPVAWKMALAMAAATPTMPISPMPLAPSGLTISSCSSTKITSSCWMSACTGKWYSARLWFIQRPSEVSIIPSSCRPMPIPQTMPPATWFSPVLRLRMRPAATAVTTRLTWTLPKSSSTLTSTNTAEWVPVA